MEKISAEAKKRYAEKIKEYKNELEAIQYRSKELDMAVKKAEQASENDCYKRFDLAGEYLDLVSYYILMNSLSLSLLGMKNEGYLNEARKCCYKSIIYLEKIVSSYLDAPFSDYEEKLASIQEFDDKKKYNLVQKLGFSIDSVVEGFGENSKWKWSFVELEGRYAIITKNMINLKTFISRLDPRVEGYSERLNHLNLCKRLLQQSSDRYREKYELSTLRLDDIKQAILFLSALRRLHILFGETDESEVVKKKIDIWTTKMESDQKKKETDQRMKKLKRD